MGRRGTMSWTGTPTGAMSRRPWNQKTGLRLLSPPHKEKTGSLTTCTCLRTNIAERKRRRSATGRGTDLDLASGTVRRRRSVGRGHAPGRATGKTKRKRRRRGHALNQGTAMMREETTNANERTITKVEETIGRAPTMKTKTGKSTTGKAEPGL